MTKERLTYIGLENPSARRGEEVSIRISPVTVFGVTYKTPHEACEALSLSYPQTRLRLGKLVKRLNEEHAATCWKDGHLVVHPTEYATEHEINLAFAPRYIFVRNRYFRSIGEAAEAFLLGDKAGSIRNKLKRQNDLTQTDIDTLFDPNHWANLSRGRAIHVKGIDYKSLSDAAKANSVDTWTASRKLSELGDNPTQAQIDIVFSESSTHTRNPKSITVFGVKYPSVTAAARTLCISQSTVDARLRRLKRDNNLSPETINGAFHISWTLPGVAGAVIVNGKRYPSLKVACEKKSMSLTTVVARLNTAISLGDIDLYDLAALFAPEFPANQSTPKLEASQ